MEFEIKKTCEKIQKFSFCAFLKNIRYKINWLISLTTLGWYVMFFFSSELIYTLQKVLGQYTELKKTMLNIANFGGKIHNVMCQKQSEVRWKTILLSCILTISTGSIPGHDLSFSLCIQGHGLSKHLIFAFLLSWFVFPVLFYIECNKDISFYFPL